MSSDQFERIDSLRAAMTPHTALVWELIDRLRAERQQLREERQRLLAVNTEVLNALKTVATALHDTTAQARIVANVVDAEARQALELAAAAIANAEGMQSPIARGQ